jgi:hypothetical protein
MRFDTYWPRDGTAPMRCQPGGCVSFIAQTACSYPDKVGLASCIANARGAEEEKGVIREKAYVVRYVTQPGSPSLGEVGS